MVKHAFLVWVSETVASYEYLISEEGLSQLHKGDSGRTSRYWSTFWPLSLSELHLSTIISYFTSSPDEVKQVPWYAHVCELLADVIDQDSHEQDIEDGDHGVGCSLLLLYELGPALICTVVKERPEYEHCHVGIEHSLMKIQ